MRMESTREVVTLDMIKPSVVAGPGEARNDTTVFSLWLWC